MLSAEGGPAKAVALNVTAGSDPRDAVSVFAPVAVPRVQPPTVATPDAFVVAVPPLTEPPPEPMTNETFAPAIELLNASATRTAGATPTVAPTVPDWLLPA